MTQMRIYSNTLLSWPQTIKAFQAAHTYPGRWVNYNFYIINNIKPLTITTNYPIEPLQDNYMYYCYDNYYRDEHLEQFDNKLQIANIQTRFAIKEKFVHIPELIEANDIIIIKNNKESESLNINFPKYPSTQALQ